MTRRGQSGLEYTLITAFALLALTPVMYLLFTSLSGYETETASAQVSAIGRQVVATAERVYHFGAPSKLTLSVQMPRGIANLTVQHNDPVVSGCSRCTELVFTLSNRAQVITSSKVDIHGPTPGVTNAAGVTIYTFNESFFNPGVRAYTLEAFPGYVELRQS